MYTPPIVNYKKRRKSVSIPDQSLSIQEIMKRYVRGIPVDVVQRQGVYIDQSEFDLEKLNRQDFGEKAELAQQMAARASAIKEDWANAENDRKEAEAKARDDKRAGAPAPPPAEPAKA